MSKLSDLRIRIRQLHLAEERTVLQGLANEYGLSSAERSEVSQNAAMLVSKIRTEDNPGLMELFLAEYGLSTDEGVALMCLAEALLRVPDARTIDDLIEDKIAASAWGLHLGKSSSSLVNASTWALMLTGKVLKDTETEGIATTLHRAVKHLGEPVIRAAVKRAMKEMGHQFVLGQDISEAVKTGNSSLQKGYTFSYDMLGEAALTAKDAAGFFASYRDAINELAQHADFEDVRQNPGISIKLSALYPRYEVSQKRRVMKHLVPRVKELALIAKASGMGLNIDAEEADRLDLSLDVIEAVIQSPEFEGWDGFGVVVQAYSKRAGAVIDWLNELAEELDRHFMVRLVKGAYWDTEIKLAQVEGVSDFPVFTNKSSTDVSYICCARKLFYYSARLYPQFATHNAHTVCAVLKLAEAGQPFEFQRLHGMGEALHQIVLDDNDISCRIYAPVGKHRDLLAYLVRRLLENGANSSFVNQMVDKTVTPQEVASDPFVVLDDQNYAENKAVIKPNALYQPVRVNSAGWDLRNFDDLEAYESARDAFQSHEWLVDPIIAVAFTPSEATAVYSPSNLKDCVGHVSHASVAQIDVALNRAESWSSTSAKDRSICLNRAADLYEENAGEIFAALGREAGKTAADAVAEIREAVDFLRYYAAQAIQHQDMPERGIITCISPWNFPLAIFTGQISAALAAGNGVLAKPADPTPIVASIGVRLMHEAGVPAGVLQLIIGEGSVVGAKLTTDPRINGICFTGSTGVAQLINRNSAPALAPDSTFIAETGGLNVMIVDSTALPEQAVQDIVDSAFRSAGQRCSALRVLYLQNDIADDFLDMLYGAMDELVVDEPWSMATDVGPIITETARKQINQHIEVAKADGRLLKQLDIPSNGYFVGPAAISISGIEDLGKEIFGPVLHVATFNAKEINQVVEAINATGYGLTFGLHTRIDDRVESITNSIDTGNIYVNRNQIGAVVGSQPFGGTGLSGTGPKAGGPYYVKRFKYQPLPCHKVPKGPNVDLSMVQANLDAIICKPKLPIKTLDMPGPTGESNRWSIHGRGTILCLGPTASDVQEQMSIAKDMGCSALGVAPNLLEEGAVGEGTMSGFLDRSALTDFGGFDAVALWSDIDDLTAARHALAERRGPYIPLIATSNMHDFCILERHICIDTTAAGGNTSLLAAQ